MRLWTVVSVGGATRPFFLEPSLPRQGKEQTNTLRRHFAPAFVAPTLAMRVGVLGYFSVCAPLVEYSPLLRRSGNMAMYMWRQIRSGLLFCLRCLGRGCFSLRRRSKIRGKDRRRTTHDRFKSTQRECGDPFRGQNGITRFPKEFLEAPDVAIPL